MATREELLKYEGLPQLALVTAQALLKEPGIDGVFVMVFRKSDHTIGAVSLCGPDVLVEDMFANTIKAAVDTRDNALNTLRDALKAKAKQE